MCGSKNRSGTAWWSACPRQPLSFCVCAGCLEQIAMNHDIMLDGTSMFLKCTKYAQNLALHSSLMVQPMFLHNCLLHVHSCSRRQAPCGVTFYSKGSQSLSSTSENFFNEDHEFHIRSFLDKMWHDVEWHHVLQSGLFLGQHGSSLGKGLDTREPGLEQVWNESGG